MSDYTLNVTKTLNYKRPEIEKGYTDQTLRVNISDADITIEPVAQKTKDTFIGGKGYDLWLLWNAVQADTRWDDPQNAICIACGPLGGTPIYPGSGKSIVTTLSPLTDAAIDSNVGGYFGPYLKFSGFDALQIQGKASRDTVIYIDGIDQQIQILDAAGLPENAYELSSVLTDHFAAGKPRNISVVSTGPGARNTRIGCLNFTWYDPKRKRARYKQIKRCRQIAFPGNCRTGSQTK